jgi:hypothetical protein
LKYTNFISADEQSRFVAASRWADISPLLSSCGRGASQPVGEVLPLAQVNQSAMASINRPPRRRRLERYCNESRYALAVFKSAVSKPSLKRSYTDCRRRRASTILP